MAAMKEARMNDLTPLPSRPLPVPALVAAAGE
jgi:hypothetical protein